MADPQWPSRTEPHIGENDLILPNVFDRANAEMYGWFGEEHDPLTGVHTAAGPLCLIETYLYTGNSTARQIDLQNVDILPKYIEIYCSDATYGNYLLMRSSLMTGNTTKYCTNQAFVSNEITELGQGYFKIGTSDYVNKTDVVYFYTVWGELTDYAGVSDTGTYSESEIDWIQDGEYIEISATPNRATDPMTRSSYQYLQKWRAAHFDTGRHKASAFATTPFELVAYTGDGGSSYEHVLTDTTITIASLKLWANDTTYPLIKTSSMASNALKYLNNTALDTSGLITFGTNSFTINSAALNALNTSYFGIIFGA